LTRFCTGAGLKNLLRFGTGAEGTVAQNFQGFALAQPVQAAFLGGETITGGLYKHWLIFGPAYISGGLYKNWLMLGKPLKF